MAGEQLARAGSVIAAVCKPGLQPLLLGNEGGVTFTAFSTVDFKLLHIDCLITLSPSSLSLSLPPI